MLISAASVQAQAVLDEIDLAQARYRVDPTIKVLVLQIGAVGLYAGSDFLNSSQRVPFHDDLVSQTDEIARAIGLGPYSSNAFRNLVSEKTKEFVGRDYVFSEMDRFLNADPHGNGYIVLEGDPGVGKSAILAEYLRRTGTVAFFNSASEGINLTSHFLDSISTQLSLRLNLPCRPFQPSHRATVLSCEEYWMTRATH